MAHFLECLQCRDRAEPTVRRVRCAACGGLFKIAYDSSPGAERLRTPLDDLRKTVTLGEGDTPVVELSGTAERLGIAQLWVKLEFMSPTGSFKDRGSAVLVSAASSESVTEFVEDSSGNAGASLSAYAAAAKLKAHVFVPANAARGKLDQIRIFGAELHQVEGPRQAATEAAEKFVSERSLPYLSHNLSPYFSEGMKAFAYEVAKSPAASAMHIVLPVGNGSLLIGAKARFDELVEAGVRSPAPRFHAVQAESVQAIVAGTKQVPWSLENAWPTVASGIAVSSPPRLQQCVDAVSDSGGSAVAVSDEAILQWQKQLASDEGIFCEATSAAAFAGLEKLIEAGIIGKNDQVLVPITGSGLKEPVR